MADLTQSDIQERVDDWIARLNDLQALVTSWFSGDAVFSIKKLPPVKMYEPLMKDFKIRPHEMPSFALSKGKEDVALFKPNALWVIGANGRVDIFTARGETILVDMAAKFQSPQWKVIPAGKRGPAMPFSKATLQGVIQFL